MKNNVSIHVFFVCHPDKDNFYLDKLISKEECITVENITCKINTFYDVIYNKIYRFFTSSRRL